MYLQKALLELVTFAELSCLLSCKLVLISYNRDACSCTLHYSVSGLAIHRLYTMKIQELYSIYFALCSIIYLVGIPSGQHVLIFSY